MDRKDFIKSCTCGMCIGAVSGAVPSAQGASDTAAKPEDWRLSFVQKRYARLMDILASKMKGEELEQTLFELGTFCSALGEEKLKKFQGDFEGYARMMEKTASGDIISYDWEKGVITMTSHDRTDCFCPLVSKAAKTPALVCNCSLGWQKHTWETLLQKPVTVELKESVLRGSKRCTFEIRFAPSASDSSAKAAAS